MRNLFLSEVTMSDIKAFMIGPKAENLEMFKQLIIEALDDHLFWRRNAFTEDPPVITSFDKKDEKYGAFQDRLRDLLFEFLSDAKKGVPFFSPRYIGHMNTDLLIPALIGYFASMLYNQNNVAGEAAPMTTRLEQEVIVMLARMVGFPVHHVEGEPFTAGYVTSGGTTANIYALWVARNARTWPIALRLLIENPQTHEEKYVARILSQFKVKCGSDEKEFGRCSLWELMNVPVSYLFEFRNLIFTYLVKHEETPWVELFEVRKIIEKGVRNRSLGTLGFHGFYQTCEDVFGHEANFLRNWKVVLAESAHYSWKKALDVLGLGSDQCLRVPLGSDFTLDISAFQSHMEKALKDKVPVLFVTATFGTTEEGALDPLPDMLRVLETMEERGLSTWFHVDACYGGYLASMIRVKEGGKPTNSTQLQRWLTELAVDFGVEEEHADELVNMSERFEGFLDWDEFIDRTRALAHAHSLSIDPHKLGYIPYPAGAVLIRDPSIWEVVSMEAPYLWLESKHVPFGSFAGKFTLEGSRPGASAAACWLAHRAVPLSQEGHGRILGLSILATRELLYRLEEASQASPDSGVAFINLPHMNMICYIPYHIDAVDFQEISEHTDKIAQHLSAMNPEAPFKIVRTALPVFVTHEKIRKWFKPTLRERLAHQVSEDGEWMNLPVLRSVVMNPFGLNARTRVDRERFGLLFDEFARELLELTKQVYLEKRLVEFMTSFRPGEIIPIFAEHPALAESLATLVEETIGPFIHPFLYPVRDIQAFLQQWKEGATRIRYCLFLGHTSNEEQVYDAIAPILRHLRATQDRTRKCLLLIPSDLPEIQLHHAVELHEWDIVLAKYPPHRLRSEALRRNIRRFFLRKNL